MTIQETIKTIDETTYNNKISWDMDNELFGERHEQEENGLFGKRHEAELLEAINYTHSCACDKPIFDEWSKDGLSKKPCIVCDKPIA